MFDAFMLAIIENVRSYCLKAIWKVDGLRGCLHFAFSFLFMNTWVRNILLPLIFFLTQLLWVKIASNLGYCCHYILKLKHLKLSLASQGLSGWLYFIKLFDYFSLGIFTNKPHSPLSQNRFFQKPLLFSEISSDSKVFVQSSQWENDID